MSSEAGTIFHASEMPRLAATTAIVIQGRASRRMPGISPGRSGLRRGVGMRARRVGRSGRSSFGARFRSRVPQYGHSVTYGLTSEPQLLQTTLSSVSATPPGYPRGGHGPAPCVGDHLLHERRQVAMPLPVAKLAVGTRSAS